MHLMIRYIVKYALSMAVAALPSIAYAADCKFFIYTKTEKWSLTNGFYIQTEKEQISYPEIMKRNGINRLNIIFSDDQIRNEYVKINIPNLIDIRENNVSYVNQKLNFKMLKNSSIRKITDCDAHLWIESIGLFPYRKTSGFSADFHFNSFYINRTKIGKPMKARFNIIVTDERFDPMQSDEFNKIIANDVMTKFFGELSRKLEEINTRSR